MRPKPKDMDGCGLGAQEPDEKSGFPVVQKIRLDDHSTPSQKTQSNRSQLTRDEQSGVAPWIPLREAGLDFQLVSWLFILSGCQSHEFIVPKFSSRST